MKNNKAIDLLQSMLDAIKVAEDVISETTIEKFRNNNKDQYAVIRSLEVLGGVAKILPKDILDKRPDLEWDLIIKTRDKLSHLYITIEGDVLWNTVILDLPLLKEGITGILKSIKQL